jgi:antitoxin ParD1/3/4
MASNTSVLLGEHYDEFISKEVSSGRYNSASKVILVNALVIGEKSPRVLDFDPKAHLKKLHRYSK